MQEYLVIVSSVNQNMSLAKSIVEELSSLGKSAEIIDIVRLDLPMYTSVLEEASGIPSVVKEIVAQMQSVEGYIFVAPEYNYSIPPTLTNYVAWISRVGDDFRALFNEKVVLNATFSGGGGDDVLNAMRIQFTRLGGVVIPREVKVNYQQALNQKSLQKTLKQFIKYSN